MTQLRQWLNVKVYYIHKYKCRPIDTLTALTLNFGSSRIEEPSNMNVIPGETGLSYTGIKLPHSQKTQLCQQKQVVQHSERKTAEAEGCSIHTPSLGWAPLTWWVNTTSNVCLLVSQFLTLLTNAVVAYSYDQTLTFEHFKTQTVCKDNSVDVFVILSVELMWHILFEDLQHLYVAQYFSVCLCRFSWIPTVNFTVWLSTLCYFLCRPIFWFSDYST